MNNGKSFLSISKDIEVQAIAQCKILVKEKKNIEHDKYKCIKDSYLFIFHNI